ncbi:S8 family serine peptidase [Chryseomicrobium sp. FSL W7-1435]|uniref:S8 family peptidase n=1 Tax=Chryseomicrobium sp. FSL W7-1435 TaxID=2921704 RepID=UPI00315ADB45
MKFRQGLGLTALALLSTLLLQDEVKAKEAEKIDTDQVIVEMKSQQSLMNIEKKGHLIEQLPHEPTKRVATIKVPDGQTMESYITELEAAEGVVSVEPDYKYRLFSTTSQSLFDLRQSHHAKIESVNAWNVTRGAQDVVVAVLDAGPQQDHLDYQQNVRKAYTLDEEYTIDQHGTHVTGLIGAVADNGYFGAGVAPGVSLYLMDVFDGEAAYVSTIADSINEAVEDGVDIINMSLGGYQSSELLNRTIQNAHRDYNVVFVAAAGNEDTSTPSYPAAYANVISVGSVDAIDKASWFSNYGRSLDIVAPGENIYSTLATDRFGTMSGTSMASPIVAGVAALIKSHEPYLTNIEIENRLYATAKDLGETGKDTRFGHGRVNAYAAVNRVASPTPTVMDLTNTSTFIQGEWNRAQLGGILLVKNGTKEIARSTPIREKGYFSIPIPVQQSGAELTVVYRGVDGKQSLPVAVRVLHKEQPAVHLHTLLTNYSTRVTGAALPNAGITIKQNSTELVAGYADAEGRFEFSIPQQAIGTRLSFEISVGDETYEAIDYRIINGNYPDLKEDHWALTSIMYLRDGMVIGGYPDGTFQPTRQTTRAEAARMLASAMNLEVVDEASGYGDVPSTHWANDYIAAVTKAGYFTGKPGNKFDPNGQLTRAEMARIISGAFQFEATEATHFADVPAGHWANLAIAAIFEQGITTGYPNGTYRPSNPITRAEFSLMLEKSLKTN